MFAKYVVLNVDGVETPVILPSSVTHASALFMFHTSSSDIVSAGYVEIESVNDELSIHCFGKPDGPCGAKVGIESRKEVDDALLATVFQATPFEE